MSPRRVQPRLRDIIDAGEAILAHEPTVPWSEVAGMRDYLTRHYFDTDHAIVSATVERDLPMLLDAVQRLVERYPSSGH